MDIMAHAALKAADWETQDTCNKTSPHGTINCTCSS